MKGILKWLNFGLRAKTSYEASKNQSRANDRLQMSKEKHEMAKEKHQMAKESHNAKHNK